MVTVAEITSGRRPTVSVLDPWDDVPRLSCEHLTRPEVVGAVDRVGKPGRPDAREGVVPHFVQICLPDVDPSGDGMPASISWGEIYETRQTRAPMS